MSLDNAQLSTNLSNLSNLYEIQAQLIRIQKNLVLISQGATGKVITVNGGSLYSLAAQYYGNANLWTTIAKANGLVDPEIPAGDAIILVIPPTTTDTGGIYEP